jgi:hypothetical protein
MLLSTARHRVPEISAMLAAVLTIVCTEAAFAKKQKEDLAERVDALEAVVAQQGNLIKALQKELIKAKQVIKAIGPFASYLTVDGEHNIYITSANLHIRSGAGATDGDVNGLGNLIIGYNESNPSNTRTGSHNLVIGPYHSYSSYGGLVAGYYNTVSGMYSSVSGGYGGTASGTISSVSGGGYGTASGMASSVSGGGNGTASGSHSSVSGGSSGTASEGGASVSGGDHGTASGMVSSVSGGQGGTASGFASSVVGGNGATADDMNLSQNKLE